MTNSSRPRLCALALAPAITALSLALMPHTALAAGSSMTTPPKPTDSTEKCEGALVWDEKTETCIEAEQSSLSGEDLLQTARALAYMGRFDDAQTLLAAHPDQTDSGVLTYWGFTNRKLGRSEIAQAYYDQALAQDPDNILARSYMGQGFVEQGQYAQALMQWKEIRARGGADTWAETSLRNALETGVTVNY